ncbi:MAG TPA: nucleotidyl transferase AbiEii/AbiGii toxin family protein [Solirubrobacterales bacterium]
MESICLTVIGTLGAYLDDLCVVGGLVPTLLIDRRLEPSETEEDRHPGTNDFDVGLSIALLDDKRYAEVSARLRAEGFGPDKNQAGNEVRQRWRLGETKVTVDFLMSPPPGHEDGARLHDLEPDMAALVTKGLDFAFDERVEVELEGETIKREKLRRMIPVCGPGAFVVLKALAFTDRMEPKDAYDLVYVLRRFPEGPGSIVARLAQHADRDKEMIESALTAMASDFEEIESIGPQRAAAFASESEDDFDALAADAHGYVADLLQACRDKGLLA